MSYAYHSTSYKPVDSVIHFIITEMDKALRLRHLVLHSQTGWLPYLLEICTLYILAVIKLVWNYQIYDAIHVN